MAPLESVVPSETGAPPTVKAGPIEPGPKVAVPIASGPLGSCVDSTVPPLTASRSPLAWVTNFAPVSCVTRAAAASR